LNLQVSTQRGLPKTLIDEGLISADKMTDAINRAKLEKCSLVTYLCQEELVDGDKIAQLAATEFGMALYDLDNHDASTLPKDLVDTKLLRKHLLLPLFY
jgi:type IV pilus assembly protein PilB